MQTLEWARGTLLESPFGGLYTLLESQFQVLATVLLTQLLTEAHHQMLQLPGSLLPTQITKKVANVWFWLNPVYHGF